MKGGAIFYNLYRPILTNLSFTNNQAEYGANIASYPIKLKLNNDPSDEIKLTEIASGQFLSQRLELVLVDYDDQVINIDSASKVKVERLQEGTKVSGTVQIIVSKGIASFTQLAFLAKPGTQNVKFKLSSNAIREEVLTLLFNSTQKQEPIDVSFRL